MFINLRQNKISLGRERSWQKPLRFNMIINEHSPDTSRGSMSNKTSTGFCEDLTVFSVFTYQVLILSSL